MSDPLAHLPRRQLFAPVSNTVASVSSKPAPVSNSVSNSHHTEQPVTNTVAADAGKSRVQRWRETHADHYRTYMRDYMARRRHAPSATQGNA